MCNPRTMSPLTPYFETQIIFPFSSIFLCILCITPINIAEGVKYACIYFEPNWKNQTGKRDFSAFFAYLPFH